MRFLFIYVFSVCISPCLLTAQTYAEKLGYPAGSKLVILHVDDAGMSKESNEGVCKSTQQGIANSFSIMMPCPWVPEILHHLKKNPTTDAGLHLTLTSEWNDYRWGPLAGVSQVPGLTDTEGALYKSVMEVVQHASANEVGIEIAAQLQRARKAGWEPTHFDSHMGTLFASAAFLKEYLSLGMREKIPVMFPGGHNTLISKTSAGLITPQQAKAIGEQLWNAGLPVLDDLHNMSYDFKYPSAKITDEALQELAVNQYIRSFASLQPGVTMVIMHCSVSAEHFEHISNSGTIRRADWLAMQSPKLKKYFSENHIELTTWRELMLRRKKLLTESGNKNE